jgi:BASS family bile acid:Na+ symporter
VVGLLVAMSLLSVVLVPLSVVVLDAVFNRTAEVKPAAVAKIMLMSVIAPLLAGLLIRRFFPKSANASHAIILFAGILLVAASAVLLYALWPMVQNYIGMGLVLMLAILVVLGLAVGHLLGGPLAGDRTSLALSTASRHPAVALAIATSGVLSDPKPELAVIILYLLVAIAVSFPYQKWRAHASEHSADTAAKDKP